VGSDLAFSNPVKTDGPVETSILDVFAPLITGGSYRTKHTWQSTKTILNYFRLCNPMLTILKEAINVGLKLCSNICHLDF
jgi:hypothetical protein